MSAFNERRFGEANHNIDYLLDSREETGGLEVVRVERSEPTIFVALTQERNFPAYRRITVKVDKPGSPVLDYVTQEPQRMPQAQALQAFDAFATRMAAADRFSGVLVVEQNGKRLYGKHFGLADRENNTPVRLDTPFLFASQGKMFTAVSVLQLIEAGKLGFDDPIGKYLTDYPRPVADTVTIHHLLTHSSGIPSYTNSPAYRAGMATRATLTQMIARFKDLPLEFEPGASYRYNNSGYFLLGAIIEKVGGKP